MIPRWTALALAAALLAAAPGQAERKSFRAGAFAQDITPEKFPVSVNGGMADRTATAAHDRLHARCLVLDDGKTRLGIVVADSCMIPRDLIDEAKALAEKTAGIPAGHILVSATHTHTAPTLTGVFQSDPNAEYRRQFVRQVVEGLKKAADALAPAEIGWAVGQEPGQVFNRRWLIKEGKLYKNPFGQEVDRVKMNPGYSNPDMDKPAGPIDPEVPVVALRTPEGRPIAALVNYSLHYVGGSPALSGDYFGAFASAFGKLVGGDERFVAILSNGTSGDINNVDFSLKAAPTRGPDRNQQVADAVARAAHEAWKKVSYRGHATLSARESDIDLGVRKPAPEEVSRAKEVLAAAAGRPLKGVEEIYARETILLADYPPTVKVKVQALRVGELGICAIPCEVFVQIGLMLKRESPLKPAFTIELANGYNGYLPTPDHHRLGGYETWRARSSYLEVNASVKIVSELLRLLGELAK